MPTASQIGLATVRAACAPHYVERGHRLHTYVVTVPHHAHGRPPGSVVVDLAARRWYRGVVASGPPAGTVEPRAGWVTQLCDAAIVGCHASRPTGPRYVVSPESVAAAAAAMREWRRGRVRMGRRS